MTSARLSGSSASPSAHIKLLDDRRFRALLSDEDWGRLPLATWRRFSKRVADGDSVVYVGVVDTRESNGPALTKNLIDRPAQVRWAI